MVKISLRSIIDDILLLVRNNNISESEDLSRAQIHLWVKAYRHQIWKEEKDKRKAYADQMALLNDELADDEFIKTVEVGPLELEEVESQSEVPTYTKRTVEPLDSVYENNPNSILAVHDQSGENIQYMDHIRRHYNYWRKYTFGELTANYKDDGHVYIQGLADEGNLKYIYVLYLKDLEEEVEDPEEDDKDEDDVLIPAWMVPLIKERIIRNELSFMLDRPSDDSNNATLASIKPHGPQDDEE